MAPDLLSTIGEEIDKRLAELRPLLAEYEQLLVAADALATSKEGRPPATESSRRSKPARGTRAGAARRGSAAGAIERAAAPSVQSDATRELDAVGSPEAPDAQETTSSRRPAAGSKPARAARGAAREAILAALEHGSHTVGELVVVIAMSGPNVNGNLRRLAAEGVVEKTEREGKTAWSLASTP
jgi:DNA-binding transcriptional ArsR family regulator